MKKSYLLPVLALMAGLSANAQNLNPTVEVSRQYKGTLMEIHKPVMAMSLPEDVDKFNLEYDYSVFDNPFKGSYEFNPYLLNINLAPDAYNGKRLYLKAGAGYTLHPTLDFVWNPLYKKGFNLSVYASHRSYIGKYRELAPQSAITDGSVANGTVTDGPMTVRRTGGYYNGYDLLSKAGISTSYDWGSGRVWLDAGYYGTALKDTLMTRGYDGVDISAGVASKQSEAPHFFYGIDMRYRFAEDKLKYSTLPDKSWFGEHDFNFSATLGQRYNGGHAFVFDAGFDLVSYSLYNGSFAANASLTPKYNYSKGRWNIDAGVKVSLLFRENSADAALKVNRYKSQIVYPDVKVRLNVVKKYLDLYVLAGGGNDLNKYSSLLAENHRMNPLYSTVAGNLMDNTVERVSAVLGLSGNIQSKFRFDIAGGYRNYANAPLWTIIKTGPDTFSPGLGYAPYQLFFARLDYAWSSQDVDVNGCFLYRNTDVLSKSDCLFAPSAFSGYVNVRYNWNRRIFVGADCEFRTRSEGRIAVAGTDGRMQASVPGYADLGVYAEFAFNRKFSFWCRGSNLINMTIQRIPLYTESGINFTAGICLNL